MKIRKTMAVSAALMLGAAGLTACGGSTTDDTSGAAATGGGDTPVELSLWTNATTGDGKAFWDNAAVEFNKLYPNVTVTVQAIQNEDMDGKLQTALNSGDAPDIFMQRGGGNMAAQVDAGQLMDITDLISEDTHKVVSDGALAGESVNGRVYGMPQSILPEGVFYSKDLFEQAGITTLPKTLDEFNAVVQKLKDAGIAPIALGAKDAWPAAHWYYNFALQACSSDTISKSAADKDFSAPCWLTAGENLQKFADTKPFNDGFLTTSAQQGAGSSAGLLANHQAAMELMGAWDPGVIGSLTPDGQPLPDLGWFPFPQVPGGEGEPGSIMGGVDGYSCSSTAPEKECSDFLNFIATTPMQEAYYKAFDAPPVNVEAQGAVTEPYLKDILAAANEAPYVSLWLDTILGSNVGNALNIGVVNLLAGQSDAAGIVKAVSDAAAKE